MSTDGDLPTPSTTDGEGSSPPSVRETSKAVVVAPSPMGRERQRRRPDWLVGQLPVGMLDDSFFYRFVSIFQEEAGSYLDGIDNLPNIIDPAVAPPEMVRFMASWLALPPIKPALDVTYQRRLVLEASRLQWWRGTKQGLSGLLELFTGGRVEVTDSGAIFRRGEGTTKPAQVTVRVEQAGWLSEADLVELVRDEVPANVALMVFVRDRQVFPTVPASPLPALAVGEEQTLNGNDDARPSGSEIVEAL